MTVMHHMKWLRSLAGWPQEVTPPWTMVVEGGALRRLARVSRTRMPQWYGLEDPTGAVRGGPARAHPSFLWYLANNTPWDRTAMEAGANAQSGEGSSAGDVFLGGDVYAFHLPIQEGDPITMVNRIGQVLEKPGRVGKLFFCDDETLFWNQHNALAATLVRRTVAIQRQGPPAPREPSQYLTRVPSPEPVELPLPRQLTLAEIETDKPLVLTKPRTVTIRDVVMWLSSVDDYIPYHYDTELASACGLPAPVVPGNMLACLLMTPL
ncbi:MAG: MaoC family dehydratase N-terminal domain-containing protein, partial [Chloroflexi bacterium]|nr:MaoC family dehydratase N-terminal domain-containing protein [Chloroflexota bacterium]